MIKAEHVTFEYFRRDESGNVSEIVEALQDISLQIQAGEFIGILGRNGSGKSTFAKLLNALLEPTEGVITVAGMDTSQEDDVWEIRKNAGMIFQNPDNQIIGTTVEEDVAFGVENLGVKTDEIIKRVADALETVGMTAYRQQSPNCLSGGQKQRVAIAGVLAMHPKCIIFDESTAMLDPQGRKEVLKAAHALNKEQNITIIYITHEMEEIVDADRIFVIHQGKIALQGTPKEIFQSGKQLEAYGLALPGITELTLQLRDKGFDFAEAILNQEAFVLEMNRLNSCTEIQRRISGRNVDSETITTGKKHRQVQTMQFSGLSAVMESNEATDSANWTETFQEEFEQKSQKSKKEGFKQSRRQNVKVDIKENAGNGKKDINENRQDAMTNGLVLDRVSYEYNPKTAYAHQALKNVSLTIAKGEFLAIIGHTGSGKSTLLQQFNGLLRPTEGHIYYEGKDIYEKDYSRTALRGRIGLVFQYPEHQLFAESVLEDVSFGPKNLGLPLLEVQQRAFQAIAAVGLEDSVYDLSPFELSGGQKRRVAIAGVLAMQPDILVLDEPVAGLDPAGRKELLELLRSLNEQGMTIVLVSHNMEDVAEYAERVIVLEAGTIALDGRTADVFQDEELLNRLGLEAPMTTRLMHQLKEEGYRVDTTVHRMKDAIQEIMMCL